MYKTPSSHHLVTLPVSSYQISTSNPWKPAPHLQLSAGHSCLDVLTTIIRLSPSSPWGHILLANPPQLLASLTAQPWVGFNPMLHQFSHCSKWIHPTWTWTALHLDHYDCPQLMSLLPRYSPCLTISVCRMVAEHATPKICHLSIRFILSWR